VIRRYVELLYSVQWQHVAITSREILSSH